MEELLRLARQLRPASLDDLGLIAAIEGQLARFSEQTGDPDASSTAKAYPEAITEEQQTVIYRVVQEALSNTAQHSAATFVDFELRVFPSHGVELRVRDNGEGFDSSGADRGRRHRPGGNGRACAPGRWRALCHFRPGKRNACQALHPAVRSPCCTS